MNKEQLGKDEVLHLDIHGKKLVFNMEWTLEISDLDKELSARMKDSDRKYGVKAKSDGKTGFFGLTDENSKGLASAALFFKGCLGKEMRKAALFFRVNEFIKDTKVADPSSGDIYWFCAFNENGAINPLSDVIVDEGMAERLLSEYQDKGFKIITTEDSVEETEAFTIVDLEKKVSEFEEDESIKIAILVVNSKGFAKKLFGVAVVAGFCAIYFLFFTIDPLYEELQTDMYNPNMVKLSSQYKKIEKHMELAEAKSSKKKTRRRSSKKETIDPEKIKKAAIKSLVSTFERKFYTNQEIYNNLLTLKYGFPTQIDGWRKGGLLYKDNQFYVEYFVNNTTDFNNFIDFDAKVAQIGSGLNLVLQPESLQNRGLTRIYEVVFPSSKKEEYTKKSIEAAELQNEISAIKVKALNIVKERDALERKIKSLKTEVVELSWIAQRFGPSLENIKNSVLDQDKNLISNLKELEKLSDEFDSINKDAGEPFVDPKWLSGSADKYVVMIQDEPFYKWGYPESFETIPALDKKTSLLNILVAKRYELAMEPSDVVDAKIEFIENEEGDEEESNVYDIRLLGSALSTVDLPNVVIVSIVLDPETNKYKIDGYYYEKA